MDRNDRPPQTHDSSSSPGSDPVPGGRTKRISLDDAAERVRDEMYVDPSDPDDTLFLWHHFVGGGRLSDDRRAIEYDAEFIDPDEDDE